jgi:hypothetical protein
VKDRKTYKGRRLDGSPGRPGFLPVIVHHVRDGRRTCYSLPLRLDLYNQTPSAWECGYSGIGPAQLALALLADYFGPGQEKIVLELFQLYKVEVVAALPKASASQVDTDDIEHWLAHHDTLRQ